MSERIYLTEGTLAMLIRWCQVQWPNEACGLIAAHKESLTLGRRFVPITNVDPKPWRDYTMDEDEQLAAYANFDRCDEEPIIAFHSHPKSSSELSPDDLRKAVDLTPAYLVVGYPAGNPRVDEVRAWRITMPFIGEKHVEEITLEILDEGTAITE